MNANSPYIVIKGLKKHYKGGDVRALDGVDCTIERGEVLVIIGPSGSGKSTLLRSLNLLEIPSEGEIIVNGVNIVDKGVNIDLHRQKTCMVFQHFNLFPHMTVLRNMTLAPIKLIKKSKAEAEAKAMELLERVGLGDRANAYPDQLSGGQKQRAAIARTLMTETPILIFDDSLSAVDTQTDAKIRSAISERFGKATVILISHRITTLSSADKIIVLDRGKIVEEGPHDQLKQSGGIYQKIYETQSGVQEVIA